MTDADGFAQRATDAETLESVVESVQRWTAPPESGDDTPTQTALVVSCSMSSCGQVPPWPVEATGTVLDVRTLGNQAWTQEDSRVTLDSDIEALDTQHDITAVLVVGHTDCEILDSAYDQWAGLDSDAPPGIEAQFRLLRSLVGDAFEAGIVPDWVPSQRRRYRLVEYNVHRQVAFLVRALPSSVTVAGYVYDEDGAYRSFPDTWYLVALNDTTDPSTIRALLPEDASVPVAGLLE